MQNLISPEEVASMAFAPLDHVSSSDVNPMTIAVAQERFIAPVLGQPMIDSMLAGDYAQIADEWVTPALALYTRALMLPMLALRIGAAGVAKGGNQYLDAATENELRSLRRSTIAQAATLLRKAVRTIEASPESYPQYDPRANIWNHCRTDGGTVV